VKLPLFWYHTPHASDLRHSTDSTRSLVSRYALICPQVCPAMSTHFLCLHTRRPHVNFTCLQGHQVLRSSYMSASLYIYPYMLLADLSSFIRMSQLCPLSYPVNPPRLTRYAHQRLTRYAHQTRTHRARPTRVYPTSRTYHVHTHPRDRPPPYPTPIITHATTPPIKHPFQPSKFCTLQNSYSSIIFPIKPPCLTRYARQARTHRARPTRVYPTSRTYHVHTYPSDHPLPHPKPIIVSLHTAE